METSNSEAAPIFLDEHDSAAVVALLIRIVRIDEQQSRDKAIIAELSSRVAANTLARSKTVNAFSVFGFDTGDELWARVRDALGSDRYNQSIAIGKGEESPKLLEKMGDNSNEAEHDHETKGAQHPRVRDAILEYLRVLGGAGATARQVREHLSATYNMEVHEKTPGMTLYRLFKDGRVRRDKRIWYATSTESDESEASTEQSEDASETAQDAQ